VRTLKLAVLDQGDQGDQRLSSSWIAEHHHQPPRVGLCVLDEVPGRRLRCCQVVSETYSRSLATPYKLPMIKGLDARVDVIGRSGQEVVVTVQPFDPFVREPNMTALASAHCS
jgi:hypothetical protein